MATKIEWCNETWNPVVGCSKVSPGCDNCYAEKQAASARLQQFEQYQRVIDFEIERSYGHVVGSRWNGKTAFVESQLRKPLEWKKTRRIFVCSMGDLFHESVHDEWIDRVFAVMALARQHTFLVLTKRIERAWEYYQPVGDNTRLNYVLYQSHKLRDTSDRTHEIKWPLPNVHLGVTAENQEQADKRIPVLLQCPAVKRFISIEPMLGDIGLNKSLGGTRWIGGQRGCGGQHRHGGESPHDHGIYTELVHGDPHLWHHHHDDTCSSSQVDWVIVGGESGKNARPMHPDWARSIRDQCVAAGVPFLFKQWGEWEPFYDRDVDDPDWRNIPEESNTMRRMNLAGGCGFHGERLVYFKRVGKSKSGRTLDGREWNEFPK